MAVTVNNIVTPQAAYTGFGDLQALTAITSRAKQTASTNMAAIAGATPVTNGLQVYSITVKGASSAQTTTGSNIVTIWENDGSTNYWPIREIEVTAVVPSVTVPAFTTTVEFDKWIVAPGHTLWASVSTTTTASTNALMVYIQGAAL
jgi:hypothetical protein